MSYASEYTASHPTVTTPNFTQRVEMGLISNAGFIYFETPTAQTPARAAYASLICQPGGATNASPAWVELIAAQGFACDATTLDANIDTVISNRWNLMARA